MSSIFGKNLKALRKRENLTQKELAEKIGTTTTTVVHYESGGKYPQRESIKAALLDCLKCTEEELYGYSDGYYEKLNYAQQVVKQSLSDPKNEEYIEEGFIDFKDGKVVKISTTKRAVDEAITNKYPNGRFLQVKDDSVERYIPKKSYALINKERNFNDYHNHICAVSVNGYDIIFRRVSIADYDNVVTLIPQSNNPKYEAVTIHTSKNKKFEIIGRVVWFSNDGEDL